MSDFRTLIPVDVNAVTKLFPKDARLLSVKWTGEALELKWETSTLETPYTFPVDYPIDRLKAKKMPELPNGAKVRVRQHASVPPTPPVPVHPNKVDKTSETATTKPD